MKKLISMALTATLLVSSLAGCGGSSVDTGDLYKVGLTTDSGTIDDKSFNQGAYEGMKWYEDENKTITTNYLQPTGEAESDYLQAFADLIDTGYEMIICPGYKFEKAVLEAQKLYPDVKFVIIDGAPNVDFVPEISDNTLSIYFAEHEAGFYAGVAAALTSNTGKVGFIGGMEIPAVQKFGWGYTAGVAYANQAYGTNVEVSQYLYQGTFTDVADGKAKANDFYNQGIDIIFAAAGGVGIGVIGESKTRREAGEDVWTIGVDSDQYSEGLFADGSSSSVLTSALKNIQKSTYDAIDSAVKDNWKGGVSVVFDTSNDAVKLPDENPNLSEDTIAKYEEVYALVKDGTVVVPDSKESLEEYLTSVGYTTPSTISGY